MNRLAVLEEREGFYLPTFIPSAADITVQNRIRISGRFSKEITAVCAENQGTDDRHIDECKIDFAI